MERVTVGDLRQALADYDDEQPIMIVHQRAWPLREVIGGIHDDGSVVYLVANGGPQADSPYGDAAAWDQMVPVGGV